MTKWYDKSVEELHDLLVKKEITATELTKETFNRLKETEPKIDAFLALNEEKALEQAKLIDEKGIAAEDVLAGIPIGIKDNIVTKGLRTTAASKMLENFDPIYDATVMSKLYDKQMIPVGKLNMDEFAMGGSTENSAFKPTKNAWDQRKVPGGSSGGSAAAVAAGQVPVSLGSDTGGSIRQPAAFNGIVGMKPTYGRVSRFGLIAFASSLDQIGPLTRTVRDNALVLEAISGQDERDSTSASHPVANYVADIDAGVKGMKLAVPKEFMGEGVEAGVRESVQAAIEKFRELGATVEEVSLPNIAYSVEAYYIIASSEASSNLQRFDGIRYGYRADDCQNLEEVYIKTRSEGFGDEVKRRIMLGTFSLSAGYYDAYFKKAGQIRTLIKEEFLSVLKEYDLIIGPTAPTVAYNLGENIKDPLTMYAADILTIPVNLAGLPGMSIPCGLSNGLPVGLQIIGSYFDEKTMYQAAYAFEQGTEFHKLQPEILGGNN
ncbi:Asp-tRNA(Asn)/Glu-tRNA(Gln) amidotransferase subunit GatA [Vagococcus humatus]|uniref:Glutamyl-tRNA(Gln) amidotransferase subunit A n=1 Tax=Vagococcus humatus TaxID=1889241 RepID=A0A429Z4X8_9ENTE|nr:Asp-tRNA(Asn)/Glu-tRNA(Gln) amidotransferase subunit GatA [Vagococcus humatus]RST88748.1 Asp-tRNA(Asn)/Glu-tRNA(Gln) amidotransferase GatCAB subunit A [Vagococcus humatus]